MEKQVKLTGTIISAADSSKKKKVTGLPAVQVSANKFFIANPKPGLAVGQWSSKFARLGWDARVEENTDPSTHIDYDAWVRRFNEVYSGS